jgi:ferredoxin-NADP reductase
MKFTLKEKHHELSNITTFVFTAPEPLSWQAGQFIHYTLPHDNPDSRGIERWFTISSAPFEQQVQITTRINTEHSSSFKLALAAMQPDDEIHADAPEGDFVVSDPTRNYVFVAGGIGITPYRSILNQLHHDNRPINAELLYAIRDETDIPFKDELERIAAANDNFHITYFIGDKKIDEAVLREFGQKLDDPIYYVSGPEPMADAFKATLRETMGLDKPHSRFDAFPGYPGV